MMVAPLAVTIAIDGPAGSGKSSAAKAVAASLGLDYLDTGAMYRAMTWWMLEQGIDIEDAQAVAAECGRPVIRVGGDAAHPAVEVDGVDVATAIREPAVSDAVSQVSAVPQVRARLVEIQRQLEREARTQGRGVVMEGRDIGTVVLPDAHVKVFLTADPLVRAQRRAAENFERAGGEGDLAEHVSAAVGNLTARDALDSGRAASPLVKAEDAVEIDATHMTLAEVVAAIESLARQAG